MQIENLSEKEMYFIEYNDNLEKIKKILENNENIIICGPDNTGKSQLYNDVQELLEKKKYQSFHGINDFLLTNKKNGRHMAISNFWIEEKNSSEVGKIYDNYEYIQTRLKFKTEFK